MAEMLRVLGRVVAERRKQSGATQLDVAIRAGVSSQVVSRLEAGRRWPAQLDAVIGAYADELEMDCYDLWALAVEEARRERDAVSNEI